VSPVDLDSPATLAKGDPGGALAALVSLPDQIRGGIAAAEAIDLSRLPRAPTSVLACGMGGSGVAADVLAAASRLSGTVPVFVHKTYGIPEWCGSDTFVIASSFSGDTEEVLDALKSAVAVWSKGMAVTSGGSLAGEAEDAGWVVAPIDAKGIWPRFALGWLLALPAAILDRLDLVSNASIRNDTLAESLAERCEQWGPRSATSTNDAKRIASALLDTEPVLWGGDGGAGVAAVRWKNDINENAKMFAHAAVVPEVDHNEIVGLAREGAEGRPRVRRVLICLSDVDEDPRISARLHWTAREVEDAFDEVLTVNGRGTDTVSRFLDLALLGGFVSVYLAILRGVDPTPIDAIGRLKSALQGGGEGEAHS
jgi:glucose/mannose-6-phosphate isomerase